MTFELMESLVKVNLICPVVMEDLSVEHTQGIGGECMQKASMKWVLSLQLMKGLM